MKRSCGSTAASPSSRTTAAADDPAAISRPATGSDARHELGRAVMQTDLVAGAQRTSARAGR